jgi:hypothetical protein
MLRRDRHAAQRGQTLILAVAFLAFFGLVAASVLTFASTVESQRGSTERTAAMDEVAAGSAQFALSDTRGQGCGTVSSGVMQFPSSDKLTYNVPAGSGGCQQSSTGGSTAGASCELCILNASPANPGTTVLTTNQGISVTGGVDVNGSISGSVTATGPNRRIGLVTGATCTSCSPSPTSQAAFNDPMAGALPIPTNAGPAQTCSSCSVLSPGVYSNVSVTSSPVWMKTGVYILTGQLNISGSPLQAQLLNSDTPTGTTTDSDSGGFSASGSGGATTSGAGGSSASGGAGVTYVGTTLTDASSPTWVGNQWLNALVTVTLKKGGTSTGIVTGNGAHSITVGSWSNGLPAAGDAYVVAMLGYTANTLQDASKTWTANQWLNALVKVTLSNGTTVTDTILSNTPHTLTMTSNWTTTPTTGNSYAVAMLGYTANTLVDASKTWTVNQWQNSLVTVTLTNGSTVTGTVQSSTAHSLTMNSNWTTTPSAGNAYVVTTLGYTPNTLVDAGRTWTVNQWVGDVVAVTLSNGSTETGTVASNLAHSLTMTSNWNPSIPSAGNAYVVSTLGYTSNTLTDNTKNWTVNQWTGAIVTVTLPNSSTETGTVQSNSATTLTMTSAWSPTTPPLGSTYSIVAPVVIYLACNTSAPYWSCATGGQSGGYIGTSGQGSFNVSPYTTGQYAGISLFADQNLIDPPGASALSVSGNGGNFGGTIYVPRGSLNISGGGSSGQGVNVAGRLIVQSLAVSVNSSLHGLFLNGTVSSSGGGAVCDYYNDTLNGTEANGTSQNAQVQFEAGCASGGLNSQGNGTTPTSIISFAYGP